MGYDYEHLRAWWCARRRSRRGVETSERLGWHRWVVERWLAWLIGYHRLTLRYERSARLFTAFLTLAAMLPATRSRPREIRSNIARSKPGF